MNDFIKRVIIILLILGFCNILFINNYIILLVVMISIFLYIVYCDKILKYNIVYCFEVEYVNGDDGCIVRY